MNKSLILADTYKFLEHRAPRKDIYPFEKDGSIDLISSPGIHCAAAAQAPVMRRNNHVHTNNPDERGVVKAYHESTMIET